jgi:hypothetical protein
MLLQTLFNVHGDPNIQTPFLFTHIQPPTRHLDLQVGQKSKVLSKTENQNLKGVQMQDPFQLLAPRDGLEPPTKWLTATRSTS